jgi:Pyruvate/2-oxoacid:ferredoxin oxidoreductase delta subunit
VEHPQEDNGILVLLTFKANKNKNKTKQNKTKTLKKTTLQRKSINCAYISSFPPEQTLMNEDRFKKNPRD